MLNRACGGAGRWAYIYLRLATFTSLLAISTLATFTTSHTPWQAPRAGAACTLFASPHGRDSNAGHAVSEPLTLAGAVRRTVPGSIVCLEPGIYPLATPLMLWRSGRPSSWIVYTSYKRANPAVLTYASGMYGLLHVEANVDYIAMDNLVFDGRNLATNGILCKGCRFLRVTHSTFRNLRETGIATYPDSGYRSDYITVDRNDFFHIGNYSGDGTPGAGSAISLDQQGWYNTAPGFHSYITNNIIAGTVDGSSYHSDGNGIILDYGGNSDATPPVLIANNLVYMNGGRCIHTKYSGNAWIVNNTCYKNGLDLRVASGTDGNNGEFVFYASSGNHVINNIAYAWNQGRPYDEEQDHASGAAYGWYAHNIWDTSGGFGLQAMPSTIAADATAIRKADPLFLDAPVLNPSADGQYAHAIPPTQLSTQFHLRVGSPAIDTGFDPTTVVTEATMRAQLREVIATDLAGRPRPIGGPFDLGAYQYDPADMRRLPAPATPSTTITSAVTPRAIAGPHCRCRHC